MNEESIYTALIPVFQTVLTGIGGGLALLLGFYLDKKRREWLNPGGTPSAFHVTDAVVRMSDATARTPPIFLQLFDTTETVDRILCLRAFGVDRYDVIRIWFAQLRSDVSREIDPAKEYDGIETDQHYRSMLGLVESSPVYSRTDQLDECMLKSFYDAEGVSESLMDRMCIIKTVQGQQIWYVSVGTHVKDGFTPTDLTKIKTAMQRARQNFEGIGDDE